MDKQKIVDLVTKMCQARYDLGFIDGDMKSIDSEDHDEAQDAFFKAAEELEKELGVYYWTQLK